MTNIAERPVDPPAEITKKVKENTTQDTVTCY